MTSTHALPANPKCQPLLESGGSQNTFRLVDRTRNRSKTWPSVSRFTSSSQPESHCALQDMSEREIQDWSSPHTRLLSQKGETERLLEWTSINSMQVSTDFEARIHSEYSSILLRSPQRETSQQRARPSSVRKHKCPYCTTEFIRHHNLKSHLLTHSQSKPYVCSTCNASFRRLHDLKRHYKLHPTEQRPKVTRSEARRPRPTRETAYCVQCRTWNNSCPCGDDYQVGRQSSGRRNSLGGSSVGEGSHLYADLPKVRSRGYSDSSVVTKDHSPGATRSTSLQPRATKRPRSDSSESWSEEDHPPEFKNV